VFCGAPAWGENALKLKDIKGTFVAACKAGGQWSIWTFKADGSEQKRLTSNDYPDSDPRWSPDGRRIVFTSLRSGVPCLFIINRDGSEQQQICEGSQASWAPDGQSIIFQREGQIIQRNLQTGDERTVTPDNWMRCSFPVIAPDNSHFAVASRHRRTIGVYVGTLQGDAEPRIVSGDREVCTPDWHPGGRKLLCQSSSHIYEIRVDGGGVQQVTFGADVQHMARYSPDGTMIVYCRAPGGEGPYRMYVLRLDDEAEVELPAIGESCMYPDWHQE